MDLLLPLISLLLVTGGGDGWVASFADAATTVASNSEEIPKAYWEAVLPGIPMPPAIINLLLAQQNVHTSPDDVTTNLNDLKFIKVPRKVGSNHENLKLEPNHEDKHVHISSQVENRLKEISMSYVSQAEDDIKKGNMVHTPKVYLDLKGLSVSHGSQVEEEAGKQIRTHRTNMEENLKEILVSYGLEGKKDSSKVLPNLKKIFATYIPWKQENLNEISISYGSKGKKDQTKVSGLYGLEAKNDLKEMPLSNGVEGEDVLKEISVSYGVERRNSPKEVSISYGKEQEDNMNEISLSYGIEKGGNLKEISTSYGLDEGRYEHHKVLNQDEEDPHKVTMSYGYQHEDDPKKATTSYGLEHEKDPHKVIMSYRSEHEEDPHKVTMSYGLEHEEDPHRATMSYGSEHEEDPHRATMSYGSEHEEDPHRATMSYGSEHEEDPHRATMSYGSEHEEDPHSATMSYGSEHEEDPHRATMSYGSEHEDDPHRATMSYGSEHEMDQNMASMGHAAHFEVKGEGSHHAHFPNHKNKKQADVFFFHDMLRPGYVITPTIPPTTSLPTLLSRHIAKSIPFSIEHLSEIIAMFAPVSLTMAREIRWTLDTCDHPRNLPGQKAGCSTSLESLAELAFSLHGTHNVRAFSATNLPVDAAGTSALRGMYNVTTVRKLSESSEIVTCHDLMYPYAVYYCHTANPTAVYTVALESVDSTTAPAMIEALAVCHLDTSRWSPKNPFFELHNLKPGDVAVCHFLTKLSIIWVRGSE